MRLARFTLCAGFVLVPFLAGCATPRVAVEGTSLAADTVSNAQATKIEVLLRLSNPADESMRLLVSEYSFQAQDATYRGQWDTLLTIPPGESIELRLPAVLEQAALDPATSWSVSGSIDFRSPSRIARIFDDLGIYRPRASFSGSGSSIGPATPTGPTAPPFRNSSPTVTSAAPADSSAVR